MNKETKAIIHGIKWMNHTESEHLVCQYKKYFVEGIDIPAIVKPEFYTLKSIKLS